MQQDSSGKKKIQITEGGPYVVTGGIPLYEDAIVKDPNAPQETYNRVKSYDVKEEYHLCRCGRSSNKPFCDGTHRKVGFEGTEVASKQPYAQRADEYEGGGVNLFDDNRCAYARFCHVDGIDVWTLAEDSGESERVKEAAIAGSWMCPTGRLVARDAQTGKAYEQDFEESIVIIEDIAQEASGPYFVRGGVELVGADGSSYEMRNRYALCRCGNSRNIPFCDAMHINVGFRDGSPAFEGDIEGPDDTFEKWPGQDS